MNFSASQPIPHWLERNLTKVFVIFVILHVFVWTLVPTFLRFNLPMDSLEGATWGHQLLWGYDKNPFMNAWLTRIAVSLGGKSGWMIYLFSQLSVAACFWAVWQLGVKILSPVYSLISVMMLEGLQYYNFHAVDFNDNTLELSLWALLILFFWQAVTTTKIRYWSLVGLFAGLAMMAKYYTAVLLLPLGIILCVTKEGRQQLYHLGVYVAALIFFIVIFPHILWLFDNHFVTVSYAVQRVTARPSWLNHIVSPLQFLWEQFQVLVPGLILLLPFCFFNTLSQAPKSFNQMVNISNFNRKFLFIAGLGPLLVTALLSLLAGIKLRAGWGQPLLSLSGLLCLAWFRPVITIRGLKIYLSLVTGFFVLAVSGYCVAYSLSKSPSSANFPGEKIATTLTNKWHGKFNKPLKFVVGPRWLAGNVAFYSIDNPAVYMEANKIVSPWIDENFLRKTGAVFIWESGDYVFEINVRRRFPLLDDTMSFKFSPMRNASALPKIAVSVAFLPPSNSGQ